MISLELPSVDMEQVVDTILSPFNNWSDEFIRLKIAVYPGRLYAGDIDASKVDEVFLLILIGHMAERRFWHGRQGCRFHSPLSYH